MFNQYVLILVWIGLMAILQPSFYREEYNELTGEWDWRVKPLFAFIVMVPVIWMAATRDNQFGDTIVYRLNFIQMPNSLSEYLLLFSKDRGFRVLTFVIKTIVGNRDKVYFGILALIQSVCLIKLYRNYSIDYCFSVFLFVASSDYVGWMYNGIRQFTAVTIVVFATSYMLKKKYIPLFLAIALASTMHQSALLMIPIVFICQGRAWNKKTLMLLCGVIVSIVFLSQFTSLLDSALSETQYANVVSDYTSSGDDGTNPLRVIFYAIPTIIAFYKRKEISEYGSAIVNLCVNMSIVSSGLYVISMFTSGIFIGRLPIYASLYNYILLPWEIDTLFGSSSRIIKSTLILVYLVFYYFQLHMTWGLF